MHDKVLIGQGSHKTSQVSAAVLIVLAALSLLLWQVARAAPAADAPDLSPSAKLVDPGTVAAGGSVTYTLRLANVGGFAASAVASDTLAPELAFRPGSLSATSGAAAYDTGVITWTGAISTGEVVSITWQVDVSATLAGGTVITNVAEIADGVSTGITRTATVVVQQPTYKQYLPIILRNSPALFRGRVTFKGAPIGGVKLDLRYYDGAEWQSRGMATTAADGTYSFPEQPALSAGQRLRVTFDNRDNNFTPREDYLYFWGCTSLAEYPTVNGLVCNFDIASIEPTSPPSMLVSTPVAFHWAPRPTTQDTYTFSLWDAADSDPFYESPDVAYTDRYLLASLPANFAAGTRYAWGPNVRTPYGVGFGYFSSLVWFDWFADDFSMNDAEWPGGQDPDGTLSVGLVNGEYQILLKKASYWYPARSPSGASESYSIEVDARRASNVKGQYGFVFGRDPKDNSNYIALIDPDDRKFTIERFNGAWATLVPATFSTAINGGQAANHLKLVRDGAAIQFYANNQLLTSIADSALTGLRYLGPVALALQDNFDARFDNFQVTVIGSGPTTAAAGSGGEAVRWGREDRARDAEPLRPFAWPTKP